ncbi:MAG TPA: PEP/pyruvate-binding domain-containing protein [Abditibacteriaceae bacterium]|jgi:pyruvate,water dikinase
MSSIQDMPYIIWPHHEATHRELGGKAAALWALSQFDLPIPEWFVVSPQAFCDSVPLPFDSFAQLDTFAQPCEKSTFHLSDAVAAAVNAALQQLCPRGELVAVRSSALDEDGVQHSYAGQFESYLFVPPGEVADKIIAVWQSGFSRRVLAYRREHGISGALQPPAVLVQRMVDADAAGVAFSADPVSGKRGVAVVAAVAGIGSSLVAGECDADTYHVNRDQKIVAREIAHKSDDPHVAVLHDEQVVAIAQLARRAAACFGCAQDIEWAIRNGDLFLLQSRPISSLAEMGDPDGALNVWDNSNIVESYGGVTTPLTFSFARHVYEEVYRQFCRLLGVSPAKIDEHDNTFRHMLGLLRGRIYYNLLNWYRLLALLPGYKWNRRFMEQMMGVKEELPEEYSPRLQPSTRSERLSDLLDLVRTSINLVKAHFTLERDIQRFYTHLNEALQLPHCSLEEMRPDELAAHYHDLERTLLKRWDVPLINDFFAMIFYGVLGRLTLKWCANPENADADSDLHNALLSGQGGIISAEPAHRMIELAQRAAGDPVFIEALCHGTAGDIRRRMKCVPPFASKYEEYLQQFGERCLDELKLESLTLVDDPLPLFRAVGSMAQNLQLSTQSAQALSAAKTATHDDLRIATEKKVAAAFVRRPLRRAFFWWVVTNARRRVRDRENLRFERTRVFGRVRKVFQELGKRFTELNVLDEPRDVFYLEKDEVLGFVKGTGTTTDLKSLVVLRKTEFEGFQRETLPNRFETRGIVQSSTRWTENEATQRNEQGQNGLNASDKASDHIKGMGCSPGVVRGPVRIVTNPHSVRLQPGEIIVAERTDPGWIMLFPAAAGLIVERGSLLSHSAIVSREIGLPAVVAATGVMQWLRDGDAVELDGSSGLVRRVPIAGSPEK